MTKNGKTRGFTRCKVPLKYKKPTKMARLLIPALIGSLETKPLHQQKVCPYTLVV
jgi:hypothetical protein